MKYWWSIWAYLFLILGSAFFGALAFIFAILGDRQGYLWWPAAQIWAKLLLRIGGVQQVHVIGGEKLVRGKARIVMSNHESHFDPPTLIASSAVPLLFITKHVLFFFPIFGQALWAMGFIAINRGVQEKAFRSIDRAAREIQTKDKTILVFPEGTRTRTGEMLPFKKGGFVIAIKSKAPIIPVGIAGTYKVLPPGWLCTGRGPVVMIVGDPIETGNYDETNKEALIEKVRTEITRLRDEARKIRQEKMVDLPGKGTARD